jgi:hypothetical protein
MTAFWRLFAGFGAITAKNPLCFQCPSRALANLYLSESRVIKGLEAKKFGIRFFAD